MKDIAYPPSLDKPLYVNYPCPSLKEKLDPPFLQSFKILNSPINKGGSHYDFI